MVELFTSTSEGFTFDSMIVGFSFASTGKCNSMIELFTSKGEGFDSTIALACEQAHLYREPAKRGKVWVKRGKVSLHASY